MNRNLQLLVTLFLVLVLASCSCPKKNIVENEKINIEESSELNFKAIAELLMSRMNLEADEKVLLLGYPGKFDPLVNELSTLINNSDAQFLGAISVLDKQPESWTTDFVDSAAGLDDSALREYLKEVDLGIMLPGAIPSDRVYGLIQDNLKEGIGRTIHFHWTGAYDFNGEVLDVTDKIDQFYQEVLLTTDYKKLAESQINFETAARNARINITTPDGTDISFEIGDRPVTKQNGDASSATSALGRNLIDREIELPAGAIRVAPIETSVNGKIAFPDARWNGIFARGLVLTFEKGKVVDMKAEVGLNAVESVMDEGGDSAKSFREFALGMNPKLSIQDDWIPYYGYGSGVVRLSLGDNLELGGNVSGGYVRWNFFTNATVKVGDEVWVEDGRLLK